MKRELKLEMIAGYLPYGLRVKYHYDSGDTAILEAIGLGLMSVCQEYNGKPILRPISDLYRPITHNGKDIVPICELARISKPFISWEWSDGSDYVYDNRDYTFHYYEEHRCFIFQKGNDANVVPNQYQLFDYLHELKIDYRGLIDAGLSVDVNTLDVNPYK